MKTKIGVAIVVVLFLGYMFASPYITAYQMKNAAESHDGEALSEHVDFSALRQSLKDQMNAMLGKEMAKEESEDNPFAALGAAFGGMMVEKMVDAYVTPAGLTELMKGEKPDSEEAEGNSTGRHSEPFSDASMSYESFSKFSITIRDSESDEEVTFILRRRGIGWKLTEMMLPL